MNNQPEPRRAEGINIKGEENMAKILITKSDGTPTKSKVHALQFLEKKGISKDCLIQENGQFFYEDLTTPAVTDLPAIEPPPEIFKETKSIKETLLPDGSGVATGVIVTKSLKDVTWDTPVFDKNNERTKLHIVGTDIEAVILAKHPAGQLSNKSRFEISIGDENFIMSVDLISKLFKVWEG